MFDKELHEEYIFTSYLIKFIPKNKSDQVSIEDKIKLEYYKLEETFKGEIVLKKGSDHVLKNPEKIDTWIKPPEEEDTLENIIQRVNERFEGKFTESDRVIVERIYKRAVKDNEKLRKFARNNDEEIFNKSIFPDVFEKVAQELYIEQMNAYSKLFEDRSFYNAVLDAVAKEAYKELRSE
jgi:type I restriction enzyme, R subunit